MANKIIYKHRRGDTDAWKEWLSNPKNMLLDGEIGLEDVPEINGSPNHLRLLVGDGQYHTYETMPKIDMPGYAKAVNNAVVSQGYDYAEYFQWANDVAAADRVSGRFVTIVDNTRTIRLAQPGDKVLGVTSNTASIIGNWAEEGREGTDWAIVGMLGIVEVQHDGTCTENGYAMIGENGVATKTSDAFGYKIVNVNTDSHTVEVVLGNDSDMISHIGSMLNGLNESVNNLNIKNGFEKGSLVQVSALDHNQSLSSGTNSVAFGKDTTASGDYSHAEGFSTTASGESSHAEGYHTTASAGSSHAEGFWTIASGETSHAEGYNTTASGHISHAEGIHTTAGSDYQHVQGKYNIEDTENKYAHIVGNGEYNAPSNAHTLDWSGNAWFAGGIKVGGTGQDDENAVDVVIKVDGLNEAFNSLNIKNGSGKGSLVSGGNNVASNDYSIAIGDENTSSGKHSVTINYNNTASGKNSVATGTGTTASGEGSFSANCGTQATGDISTAFGSYTRATTTYAFSAGNRTAACGVASVALNHNNKAYGKYSLAVGNSNTVGSENPVGKADGESSSAFGFNNNVTGRYSHAFGQDNVVTHNYSSANGYNQNNAGHFSHTFNHSTETCADNQSAFGQYNNASEDSLFMIGNGYVLNKGTQNEQVVRQNAFEVKKDGTVKICKALAEGYKTTASGEYSHAEGSDTFATGGMSHTEGHMTNASGECAHAEGHGTNAIGSRSHAEGDGTIASSCDQHVQGKHNVVDEDGKYAHIVGNGEGHNERSNAHTLDWYGNAWFAGGIKVGGTGQDDESAVSVLTINDKQGIVDEVLGQIPDSSSESLIVAGEGLNSTISNDFENNTSSGEYSHAEGHYATASGNWSHAEGYHTTASEVCTHAEGCWTVASGECAHAEGNGTIATSYSCHAEGLGTQALSGHQHVQGKYNVADAAGKYAHIVGNGARSAPSNAHTLDWYGLGWFAGGLKVGGIGQDDENAIDVLAYIQRLEARIDELEIQLKTE